MAVNAWEMFCSVFLSFGLEKIANTASNIIISIDAKNLDTKLLDNIKKVLDDYEYEKVDSYLSNDYAMVNQIRSDSFLSDFRINEIVRNFYSKYPDLMIHDRTITPLIESWVKKVYDNILDKLDPQHRIIAIHAEQNNERILGMITLVKSELMDQLTKNGNITIEKNTVERYLSFLDDYTSLLKKSNSRFAPQSLDEGNQLTNLSYYITNCVLKFFISNLFKLFSLPENQIRGVIVRYANSNKRFTFYEYPEKDYYNRRPRGKNYGVVGCMNHYGKTIMYDFRTKKCYKINPRKKQADIVCFHGDPGKADDFEILLATPIFVGGRIIGLMSFDIVCDENTKQRFDDLGFVNDIMHQAENFRSLLIPLITTRINVDIDYMNISDSEEYKKVRMQNEKLI